MSLLKSWSSSLAILYPSNLKLFLLVALNSIRQAFKVWAEVLVSNFWVLFFALYSWMRLVAADSFDPILPYPYGFILALIYSILVIFVGYLTLRPSVQRKTLHYFLSYYIHFFYFLIMNLAMRFLLCGTQVSYSSTSYAMLIGVPCILLFLSIHAFSTLFFLDSPASLGKYVKAAYSGTKMILFNLPFVILFVLCTVYIFFPIVNGLVMFIDFFIPYTPYDESISLAWLGKLVVKAPLKVMLTFVYMIKALVPMAIYTNFYIKKVHEQFNLYK